VQVALIGLIGPYTRSEPANPFHNNKNLTQFFKPNEIPARYVAINEEQKK
jgi:hypothetical protein